MGAVWLVFFVVVGLSCWMFCGNGCEGVVTVGSLEVYVWSWFSEGLVLEKVMDKGSFSVIAFRTVRPCAFGVMPVWFTPSISIISSPTWRMCRSGLAASIRYRRLLFLLILNFPMLFSGLWLYM